MEKNEIDSQLRRIVRRMMGLRESGWAYWLQV
jgi:hypothetical protein